MIKDAAGIYTEAEPPLAYDPVLEAYRETEGLAYNHTLEAWQKVWPERPEKLYLYKDGTCHDFGDLHTYGTVTNPNNTWIDEICGKVSGGMIDLTGYSRLCFDGNETGGYVCLACSTQEIRTYHNPEFHCELTETAGELDVSPACGNYYVFVGAAQSHDRYLNCLATRNGSGYYEIVRNINGVTNTARIRNVWLE